MPEIQTGIAVLFIKNILISFLLAIIISLSQESIDVVLHVLFSLEHSLQGLLLVVSNLLQILFVFSILLLLHVLSHKILLLKLTSQIALDDILLLFLDSQRLPSSLLVQKLNFLSVGVIFCSLSSQLLFSLGHLITNLI